MGREGEQLEKKKKGLERGKSKRIRTLTADGWVLDPSHITRVGVGG